MATKEKIDPRKTLTKHNKSKRRWNYAVIAHYADKETKAKRFIPLYGVFCKDETGKITGYIENSFNMAFSKTHVRLCVLKDALLFLKEIRKENRKTKNKYFIYRLTRKSKNALIIANMKDRNELLALEWKSFTYRNVEFSVNNNANNNFKNEEG